MKLIEPDVAFEKQYLEMLEDWKRTGEQMIPYPLRFDPSDFKKMVERLREQEIIADKGFVCASTFWLVDDELNIIGVSNVRHELNENLRKDGGHIGYGIRPSFRRRGHANKILELSLREARKLGVKKALLTCNKDNLASAKTITNNGGVLEEEFRIDGVWNQNYWIDIS